MKAKELHNQTVAELKEREQELRKELFDLNFQHGTRQLMDTAALRRKRREVALVLTVLRQKEIEAALSA